MHHKLRRRPPKWNGLTQLKVPRMLIAIVITACTSPWSLSVVIETKKDGKHILRIDLKEINKVTEAHTYPLSNINETLQEFGFELVCEMAFKVSYTRGRHPFYRELLRYGS